MICGICKKESKLTFKEKHKDYSLYECSLCKGQFWNPMKNPGAEWYEKDVRYSFRNKNPLKTPEVNHREFLKDLPALGGKLLDIGMGTGNFLAAAITKGYDGYGIDFDADAIETAKEFFNLKNAYVSDTETAIKKFGAGFFDAITMFEVLEHLENPSESIKKIRKGITRAIEDLNRIEFPEGKVTNKIVQTKNVSDYIAKPKRKWIIITLIIILVILLGALGGIFLFRKQVLSFFDNSNFFSGIFG